jgi:hypothetical protein
MTMLHVSVDINPGKAGGKLNRAALAVNNYGMLLSSGAVGVKRHRLSFLAKPTELQKIRTRLRLWSIGVHGIKSARCESNIAPAKA